MTQIHPAEDLKAFFFFFYPATQPNSIKSMQSSDIALGTVPGTILPTYHPGAFPCNQNRKGHTQQWELSERLQWLIVISGHTLHRCFFFFFLHFFFFPVHYPTCKVAGLLLSCHQIDTLQSAALQREIKRRRRRGQICMLFSPQIVCSIMNRLKKGETTCSDYKLLLS